MKQLTWVVIIHLFVLFSLYHIVVKHDIEINYYYAGKPYVVEYPCVIMEGPGVKYILHSPCGKITAEYEKCEPWVYSTTTN